MSTPGIVPWAPGSGPTGTGQWLGNLSPFTYNFGKGIQGVSTLDPGLTQAWDAFLGGNIGQGSQPFNLSALLPSSGGSTDPGTLTAPNNQLLQALSSFFSRGGSNPTSQSSGLDFLSQLVQGDYSKSPELQSLSNVATKGISALPVWNPMVDAMQRQIQEGQTNLKEQFNFAGNLASSPFGNAMTDYMTQSNKDLNSQLAQLQYQGIQEQVGAGEFLGGQRSNASQYLSGMSSQLGQYLQGLDQSSIDRLYQEFIRTRPEYNPLMDYISQGSFAFPGIANSAQGGGVAGGVIGSIGSVAGSLIGLL